MTLLHDLHVLENLFQVANLLYLYIGRNPQNPNFYSFQNTIVKLCQKDMSFAFQSFWERTSNRKLG